MSPSSTDEATLSSTSPEHETDRYKLRKQRILVCGASVRSLAESLVALGLYPICTDFFGDLDLRKILSGGNGEYLGTMTDFRRLPAVFEQVPRDVPIVWSGGLENHPEVLEKLAEQRTLCGVSPTFVRQVRHPQKLDELLLGAPVQRPRRLPLSSPLPSRSRWLLKPLLSAGGLGIREFSPNAARNLRSEHSAASHLEEFLEGPVFSVVAVGDGAGHARLVGASLLLSGVPSLGAKGFEFCGNLGPVVLPGAMHLRIRETLNLLAGRTLFHGLIGLDLVACGGQVFLLEVNPRVTASHWLFELRVPGSLVAQQPGVPCAARQATPLPTEEQETAAGIQLVVWNTVAQKAPEYGPLCPENHQSPRYRLADIPAPDTLMPGDSPRCSVLGTGPDIASLIQSSGLRQSLRFLNAADLCPSAVQESLQKIWDRWMHFSTGSEGKQV